MKKRTAGELLKALRKLKDKKTDLEAQLKETNIEIGKIEMHEFPEALQALGLDDPKISERGIGSATLGTRVFATVLATNKPAFLEWMKQNGNEGLVKEDIHPKTLEAWGREALTEGLDYPEDLINLTAIPVVNFRRS